MCACVFFLIPFGFVDSHTDDANHILWQSGSVPRYFIFAQTVNLTVTPFLPQVPSRVQILDLIFFRMRIVRFYIS